MISSIKKNPITYEDYIQMEDGKRYELINGELLMPPSPTPDHQRSSSNLNDLLKSYVKKNQLGSIFYAPLDVYLDVHNTVQPDLIFISNKRKFIIGEKKIEGAPDLVVEIISPGTAYYDWLDKKELYAKFGVKEYWIIDPEKRTAEIFENINNDFLILQKQKDSGLIKSKVLDGFEIAMEDIFAA